MNQDFIAAIMPAAQEVSARIGVDPRIIVAQAALETGWGRSAPGNNYFGIKSHGKGGGQNLSTTEVINGKTVRIKDSFRTFASPADSVAGYGEFLTSNPRYRPMLQAEGLDAQIDALGKSGYATDPNYASKIRAIVAKLPGSVPTPPATGAGIGSDARAGSRAPIPPMPGIGSDARIPMAQAIPPVLAGATGGIGSDHATSMRNGVNVPVPPAAGFNIGGILQGLASAMPSAPAPAPMMPMGQGKLGPSLVEFLASLRA